MNRPGPKGLPVEPFRERALELHVDGESWSAMARRAGFLRLHSNRPGLIVGDATRMRRTVGVTEYLSRGGRRIRRIVTPDTAERLCEALEIDPVEVGL